VLLDRFTIISVMCTVRCILYHIYDIKYARGVRESVKRSPSHLLNHHLPYLFLYNALGLNLWIRKQYLLVSEIVDKMVIVYFICLFLLLRLIYV
jgi:hypothetical protein